ncbi:TPA: hypothetical protein L4559_005108 [Pseudomonas aeruginosa]|nr:hypothetical protein [Pseudomonas aeruginosa]
MENPASKLGSVRCSSGQGFETAEESIGLMRHDLYLQVELAGISTLPGGYARQAVDILRKIKEA